MTCTRCTLPLESDAAFCGGCGAANREAGRPRRATLVGTVLDSRYEVVAKIAAGGFGAIYRAIDRTNGIELALKVLHAELASDASLSARFRREASVLARLRDPNTVATFGSGEAPDGTLYIALELLRGESLEDRARADGPMAWTRVLEILRAVCSSLAEAHALGIVHRDLKPANIFLSRRGVTESVKVIDFGIAKLQQPGADDPDLTRVGQAIGTLDYMAPEQLVGTSCDGRTDIYTLGVVAYEVITGSRPFEDTTGATGLITALLTRTPAPPSSLIALPTEVDRLLLRCLERDPDDRFASVDELRAAIERVLALAESPATTRPQWSRAQITVIEASLDGDDVTWIDGPPAAAMGWEVTVPVTRLDLSELDSEPPFAVPIRGSSASPMLMHVPMVRTAAPVATSARWRLSRIALAAVLLLMSGIGLGIVVASHA